MFIKNENSKAEKIEKIVVLKNWKQRDMYLAANMDE